MRTNVLVVDDDAEIRTLVEEVLTAQGYDVRAASNGAEAFAEIERGGAPDLILLDLMMPVMGGWEFCHHRDCEPDLAGVPVVLMSAQSNLERAHNCSANLFLFKPFALNVLRDTVEHALQE